MNPLNICENPILKDPDTLLQSVENRVHLKETESYTNAILNSLGFEYSICTNDNEDVFQLILKNTQNGTLVTIPINAPNAVVTDLSDYIISAVQDGEPLPLGDSELQAMVDKKIGVLKS